MPKVLLEFESYFGKLDNGVVDQKLVVEDSPEAIREALEDKFDLDKTHDDLDKFYEGSIEYIFFDYAGYGDWDDPTGYSCTRYTMAEKLKYLKKDYEKEVKKIKKLFGEK